MRLFIKVTLTNIEKIIKVARYGTNTDAEIKTADNF